MIEFRVRTRISRLELDEKVGKILTDDDYNVLLTRACRVLSPEGKLVCIYLPGALRDVTSERWGELSAIRLKTNNRAYASGTPKRVRNKRLVAKPITSGILGAIDGRGAGEKQYCRLTAFTANEVERWELLDPIWRSIADLFAEHVPDRFAVQLDHARRTQPEWVIAGTPFTTITINNTYPTGVHTDKGDLDEGFSCLAVARRGAYTGGVFVFPEYRIGVDLQDGDLVLMDAHQWHGNTALRCAYCAELLDKPGHQCAPPDPEWEGNLPTSPERVSLVCYFRTAMTSCGTLEQEDAKRAVVAEKRSARGLDFTPGPVEANPSGAGYRCGSCGHQERGEMHRCPSCDRVCCGRCYDPQHAACAACSTISEPA